MRYTCQGTFVPSSSSTFVVRASKKVEENVQILTIALTLSVLSVLGYTAYCSPARF